MIPWVEMVIAFFLQILDHLTANAFRWQYIG